MLYLETLVIFTFTLLSICSYYFSYKALNKLEDYSQRNVIISNSYKNSYITIVLSLIFVIVYQLIVEKNNELNYWFFMWMTFLLVLLVRNWTVIVMVKKWNVLCEKREA
ncbi:hypothetical protein [Alkalihalobacillus trypoxylicola]|uniref:Uncharacterized protein n=1 Tax=Alkalihalobacillus trypoxylicola TaxID=519424 RepID=A0A162EBL6_9BACI|nr:hypothetical protein [Alkalihalobacillus trypoxylicola]KYG32226.1 hypothetical protein AZF04_05520 [Alkalihalobacillus trypoxylicola]